MRGLPHLLGLLVPPRCAICGAECPAIASVCARCEAALRLDRSAWTPLRGSAVWSAAPYEGVARGLVVALKFGARITLATRAAQAIADRAPPDLLARRTVVPVPAAPARRRARGFDPADVIATALARRAGLELSRCLRRTDGPRQVGRSRRDRMATPPRVVVAADTAPASVLLVDDVLTTGATLEACARALHAAGVESVEAVTFALSTGPRAGRSVGVA